LFENGKISPAAAAWLDHARADVCVFGHSHRPMVARRGRTLLLNPGSAGPRRFSLPRGIGVLTVKAGNPRATLIRLDDRVAASARRTSVRAKGAGS
jgi:predicted phosphodiesterase